MVIGLSQSQCRAKRDVEKGRGGGGLTRSTYHQAGNDVCEEEEGNTRVYLVHIHTVPHRLDPLSAQNAEDDHEAVQEVDEVPPATWRHMTSVAGAMFVL